MNTNENFNERLERYLAGELPEAERAAFEAELDGALEQQIFDPEIRPIIDAAHQLPKALKAPAEDWAAIEKRLEPHGVARDTAPAAAPPYLRMLAAAGIVLAAGLLLFFGQPSDQVPAVANAPEPPPAQVVIDWERDFEAAEEAYREARAALLAELDAREVPLSAETRATLEANVAVIDEAVSAIRMAVEEDPANPRLMQMLVATRDKELNFLGQLVRIPAGI